LLDYPPAKNVEFAQHLQEVGTAELSQFEVVQGAAGRRSHAGWKYIDRVTSRSVKRTLHASVNFFDCLVLVIF
jgi:hypothetical protein